MALTFKTSVSSVISCSKSVFAPSCLGFSVSKSANVNRAFGLGPDERIPQRSSKRLALDLNDVTGLGLKAFLATQYAGTEEMDMDIPGSAKHGIFEMMMLQVCD
jgi:hypothetical protein